MLYPNCPCISRCGGVGIVWVEYINPELHMNGKDVDFRDLATYRVPRELWKCELPKRTVNILKMEL